jgi:hypothetical protein
MLATRIEPPCDQLKSRQTRFTITLDLTLEVSPLVQALLLHASYLPLAEL